MKHYLKGGINISDHSETVLLPLGFKKRKSKSAKERDQPFILSHTDCKLSFERGYINDNLDYRTQDNFDNSKIKSVPDTVKEILCIMLQLMFG